MIDAVRPAFADVSPEMEKEKERHLLHLIGEALIDHKERLYSCHRTGFTAEVAWPIMESILGKIRPYVTQGAAAEPGLRALPSEPTAEMIDAALNASLKLREERAVEEVQPDSSGSLPSDMVRVVWRAMIERLPSSAMPEAVARIGPQNIGAAPERAEFVYPAENENDIGRRFFRDAMQKLRSLTRSLLPRAERSSGHSLVKQ